jgi:hypothetical protein
VGLRLNKVSDEIALESLEHSMSILTKLLERGPRSSNIHDIENYYDAVGDTSCDIGMTLYQQQEDPHEIRVHLARAADFTLRKHACRPEPAPNTSRSPWFFKKAAELVICWGDVEKRRALATIHPWQYRNPPHPEHDGLAEYLELLVRFLAEQRLDVEMCFRLEERLASNTASKDDRQLLLPFARGLHEAMEGSSSRWNDAIAEIVKAHEIEAKKGEYKRSANGFMCLPGLALAQLGLERGLTCSIRSIYLPLQLLEIVA